MVESALINVNRSLRKATRQEFKAQLDAEARKIEEARRIERVRQGTWHDGRLDCVAGNGIMSELGVGDEFFGVEDSDVGVNGMDGSFAMEELKKEKDVENELIRKESTAEEVDGIAALPVVVIKNYGARSSVYREELQKVLSQWVATLVENKVGDGINCDVSSCLTDIFQIAHVVVVSDNRENAKLIALGMSAYITSDSTVHSPFLSLALPSKPLNSIPLYDADTGSSLAFVKQRLCDAGMTTELTAPEVASIECLGGRASDLEIVSRRTLPI